MDKKTSAQRTFLQTHNYLVELGIESMSYDSSHCLKSLYKMKTQLYTKFLDIFRNTCERTR